MVTKNKSSKQKSSMQIMKSNVSPNQIKKNMGWI